MISKVLITLSNANLAPLGKFNQIFSQSHPVVSAGIVVSFIQSRKVISFDGAINANIPREKIYYNLYRKLWRAASLLILFAC